MNYVTIEMVVTNLDNAISLPEEDVSGDDSKRTLLLPRDCLDNTEFECFSSLLFVDNIGEQFSWRILPSDKDLLNADLNIRLS